MDVKGLVGLDFFVITFYLIASIAVGAYAGRSQKDLKDYFVAGRSIGWFVVALTIIATNLSAISYMGAPEVVFRTDLKPTAGQLLLIAPLACVLVVWLLVRIFYRLNIITIYEYLERRFSLGLRLLASLLFLCAKCGWLATVLYVPALTLSIITGFSMPMCILITGLSATLYASYGGTKAVIWTDVMQFFVLVGGIVVALGVILWHYTPLQVWTIASNADLGGRVKADHTVLVDLTFNPTVEFTLWSIFAYTLITVFFDYGLNQIVVQRYLAARSLKDCVKGVLGQSLIVVPIILSLYLTGLGLVAYYHDRPFLLQHLLSLSPNQNEALRKVFAHFIVTAMPSGLSGLVIAGVLAATMSSVSSAVNSLTAVTIVDYYRRFWHTSDKTEAFYVKVSRGLSAIWGVVATGLAMYVGLIGTRIVDILGTIYGYLTGPLVGIFLLGVLTRRANSMGAFVGALLGLGAVTAVANGTEVFWQWYPLVGFLTTFGTGYLISLAGSRPDEAQLGMTLWGTSTGVAVLQPVSKPSGAVEGGYVHHQ